MIAARSFVANETPSNGENDAICYRHGRRRGNIHEQGACGVYYARRPIPIYSRLMTSQHAQRSELAAPMNTDVGTCRPIGMLETCVTGSAGVSTVVLELPKSAYLYYV